MAVWVRGGTCVGPLKRVDFRHEAMGKHRAGGEHLQGRRAYSMRGRLW